MEFAENIADVSLDRILANDQLLCDLAVGQPGCDQFQNIGLSVGQFSEEGLFFSVLTADVLQNACRHTRVQGHFALYRAVQNFRQLFHFHVFQNISDRASF